MKIDKNILLTREGKKSILIDTFYSEEKINQPIVIFCHGYKGFKDWGAWNLMAKHIADEGFCFIKFNFSHNGGTVNDPIDFPDLEAFGNNNYTKELEDLNDVIDWSQEHFKNNSAINTTEISLIGHSRGGGIAIIKASEDSRITKLITLASVSNFENRFGSETEIENWKEKGVKYVKNGRTKQEMPHYVQFLEDFEANKERLHIESATKSLELPVLIIHGDKDTSVNIDEAYNIYEWSKNSQLEIVENAGHVFNTKHPWEKDILSVELNHVSETISKFLK
ncbi:prolyl oligopeptidase family serine peptidase [Winogradskyella undariae]|uniref:alpha/beta hydrolase family protein n=1 Tax=Winogradskyella undariae TaxID=1285465 RepID=UPI00156AA5B8|nr:alpha/beta fold hydrolase [Winogradskyella undariae]NRR91340.1 prolyl oligopeptidase family serine peptidase [Winogradskyella undariae]